MLRVTRVIADRREEWNAFVSSSPWGHIMQTCEWGDFKSALGWRVQRVAVERDEQMVAGAQLLFRSLPVLPLTVAYIPKGPIVDLADGAVCNALFSAIHQVTHSQRAIFLKVEPNMLNSEWACARVWLKAAMQE